MALNIYSKRLGINFSYLIKAEGCIMIDTGPPQSVGLIKKWLQSIPVRPEDIQLIVLTHGHSDHSGAAAEIKEITGSKIAMHKEDQKMFEGGEVNYPTPTNTWGRIFRQLMGPLKPLFKFRGCPVDVVIGDEGFDLHDLGIPGRIIHTPGHTPGSISVLLDNGEAFIGCMTHNAPPFRLSPNHPIFAEDLATLWKSWHLIIEQGAKTIYPGHGNPFPIDQIAHKIPVDQASN